MAFQYANISAEEATGLRAEGSFTLLAEAPTDIWRKPPYIDVFDAPIVYRPIPVSSFKRAQVTANGEWKTLYDQGGLVLVLPAKKCNTQKRWVKAGIEFYQNKPCMSVVAADEWADWSLLPLPEVNKTQGRMTVEMERGVENGRYGSVFRVLLVSNQDDKLPIREIIWASHDLDEDEEMWIGIYAAKPTKDVRQELEVRLEEFVIETRY